MSLSRGTALGPYEVVEQIGAGGMGEVYRARDTRLGREVAIKVAAQQFSERFDREARAIAALNHPNICTLHDIGPNYLVMELVEGPTLSDRIKEGPIPPEEALTIARQIAAALEAAHEKGIIHRDLKPGNVKIKRDGSVKVLDFGLAKVGGVSGPRAISEDSPTMSMAATQAGVVLGTAAYMAPEQARGKEVDKRADIWAFGVVLYEMLTRRRPFTGEDLGEVLASVIKEEPSWQGLPDHVRPLIQSCMAKDPNKRLRDIGDIDFLLRSMPEVVPTTSVQPPSSTARYLWPGLAAAALILMAGVGFVHLREKPPAMPATVRFQISPPEGVNLGSYIALSPDGTQLVFTGSATDGRTRLYVRSLNSLEARVLPGTENAASPQWSPDGKLIAFGDGGKLKKVEVAGGPPQTLCEVDGIVGKGSWNKDGLIIFSNRAANPGVWKIPASGGTPIFVTKTDPKRGETYRAFPTFLPDGKHFFYLVNSTDQNVLGLYVGSVDLKPEEQNTDRILPIAFSPIYAHSEDPAKRRLLYLRDRTLVAQQIDLATFKLTGDAVRVTDAQIGVFGSFAIMAASENGTLVYRQGDGGGITQLNWVNRQGKILGRLGDPGNILTPAISPDGTRVAYAATKSGNTDVWVHDLARDSATRLTFSDGVEAAPMWTPDGQSIIFADISKKEVRQKQSNGVGEERVLLKEDAYPQDVSRDGRLLLFATFNMKTLADLWILSLTGNEKPMPYLNGTTSENQARFSPDQRWVVYASNESGRPEIYVQPFPSTRDGGGKWMISNAGGIQPLWRQDGKEIIYAGLTGDITSVDIQSGSGFKYGIPKVLFNFPLPPSGGTLIASRIRFGDINADGQKFLVVAAAGTTSTTPLTVLLNWQSELK